MAREQSVVWNELKAALEKFQEMTTDGKSDIYEVAAQGRVCEALARELESLDKVA